MAKVKVNFNDLKQKVKEFQRAVTDISKETLKVAIIDNSILLGISPVEGQGKFAKYSEMYKGQIRKGVYKKDGKNISPVNLKLSGQMLDSFFVKKSEKGLKVGFSDEKAYEHTVRGVGFNKTKRKMLPVGPGEDFKRTIKKEIVDVVRKAVDRILGK